MMLAVTAWPDVAMHAINCAFWLGILCLIGKALKAVFQ
jgi:hypothetical protein